MTNKVISPEKSYLQHVAICLWFIKRAFWCMYDLALPLDYVALCNRQCYNLHTYNYLTIYIN